MLAFKEYKFIIDAMVKDDDKRGCRWIEVTKLKDGRSLCLVLGYNDGGIENNTLVGKLAINVSDLQCDYDVDWYMPYDKYNRVYDTQMYIGSKSKVLMENDLEWFNRQAKNIAKFLEIGLLTV